MLSRVFMHDILTRHMTALSCVRWCTITKHNSDSHHALIFLRDRLLCKCEDAICNNSHVASVLDILALERFDDKVQDAGFV